MWRHWFFLAWAAVRLVFAFARSAWRLRFKVMETLELPDGIFLSYREKKRLRHYHYGVTYLKTVFSCLCDQAVGPREEYLFSNLSTLAAFFDDLTDNQRGAVMPGGSSSNDLTDFGRVADERGLALHLLENVYRHLPPGRLPSFRAHLERVFDLETSGQDAPLDLLSLNKLTAEKGGHSVMLFRSLMPCTASSAEEAAILEFGCFVQLSDDIFDVWFDHQAQVPTVATRLTGSGKLKELHAVFERQWHATKSAFERIPLVTWRVLLALATIHWLTAITRTCLWRYRQLEKEQGKLPVSNRKMMVVDMGKSGNKLKALWFLCFSR